MTGRSGSGIPAVFDDALAEIATRESRRIDAWLHAVQSWHFRRDLHSLLGDLLERRAYAEPRKRP